MNNNMKSIEAILPPPAFHMVGDGFRVHNFFPSQPEIGMTGMDPFFLLDYGSKWLCLLQMHPGVSASILTGASKQSLLLIMVK